MLAEQGATGWEGTHVKGTGFSYLLAAWPREPQRSGGGPELWPPRLAPLPNVSWSGLQGLVAAPRGRWTFTALGVGSVWLESSLCPAGQVTFTPDLSFCIWDSRECDFDINLAQPSSSGSDLPCLCVILYSFQRSFTSILSSDSPCKCPLHRLGKICEPILQTGTFVFRPFTPFSGFWDLSRLQSWTLTSRSFVYLGQDRYMGLRIPKQF